MARTGELEKGFLGDRGFGGERAEGPLRERASTRSSMSVSVRRMAFKVNGAPASAGMGIERGLDWTKRRDWFLRV